MGKNQILTVVGMAIVIIFFAVGMRQFKLSQKRAEFTSRTKQVVVAIGQQESLHRALDVLSNHTDITIEYLGREEATAEDQKYYVRSWREACVAYKKVAADSFRMPDSEAVRDITPLLLKIIGLVEFKDRRHAAMLASGPELDPLFGGNPNLAR